MNNIYILAAVIGCCWWIWRIAHRLWIRPRRLERLLRAQGLKGNPYRFWHGDMKELAELTVAVQSKPIGLHEDVAPYAVPFHHHTVTKYGKRSFIWNGPNPRIMIMEPDLIKEILQRNDTFVKISTNPLNRLLISGIVSYERAKWAKHRRLLSPSFTAIKLRDMVPTMHVSCNELVEKLETMLSNTSSGEVDVWPIFSKFTADIISRTAFGSNYEQGQQIFMLQKEQSLLIAQLSRSVYIPGSRYLPTKINKRMKEIDREILARLRYIIRKKMDSMKVEAQDKKVNNDLLGTLLESNSRAIEENGDRKEMGISIQEVMDECKIFYFAGQETTSNLLVWTIVMLSIHQKWQMEAREEVFEVFGKRMPDFDGLPQLKKITMILHEVLRLYSPAPTLLRTIEKETEIGDITLPRGVELQLLAVLVHLDKDIWGEDMKEFKPERFANGVAKATKGQLAAFLPFSLGPRICIGMNFAMMEAKLALTMILQRFSFKLSPHYEHAPVPMLTLQPKFGAKILFSKISDVI